MTESKSVVQRANASSQKVNEYLEQRGFKRADYDTMPIRKSSDPEHKRLRIRGHQFDYDTIPKKGIVNIIPASTRTVNSNYSIRAYYDNSNGEVYGVPTGFDKDGNIQWRMVSIQGARTLDLSNKRDREDFFLLVHSHYFKDGFFDILSHGSLLVNDPLQEARTTIDRMEKSESALKIVRDLSESDLISFGVIFDGINPEQDPMIIKAALYDLAKSDPGRIIREWKNENRKVASVLKSAIHYGIVKEGPEGIRYNQISLGLRHAEAVVELRDNIDLFAAIESDVAEKKGGAIAKVSRPAANPGTKPASTRTA